MRRLSPGRQVTCRSPDLFDVIRAVLALATILVLEVGCVDVTVPKGVCLQHHCATPEDAGPDPDGQVDLDSNLVPGEGDPPRDARRADLSMGDERPVVIAEAGVVPPDAASPTFDVAAAADAADAADRSPDVASPSVDKPADQPTVAPNAAPVVSAGPDQTLYTLTAEVALAGVASDDGRPNPPGRMTLTWTKVSGPGTVTFTDATTASTRARFSDAGNYVLRLSASDGEASAQDDVAVTAYDFGAGLVGLWRLDDGAGTAAKDSAAVAHNLSLTGGVAWTAGRVGGGLDFSVDGEYASVASPADGKLSFGTGDFTVTFWMKTTQSPAVEWYPELVSKAALLPATDRHGFQVIMGNPGALIFQAWNGGGLPPTAVEVAGSNDGKWHHVAGRKQPTNMALFLDGSEAKRIMHNLGSLNTTAPLRLGGYDGEPTNDFDGQLDEVRLYSRALSDAEIAVLASGVSP